MKLKECKDWKKVIFNDRSILKKDLALMSKWQVESLMNLEVIATKQKGVYKEASLEAQEVRGKLFEGCLINLRLR